MADKAQENFTFGLNYLFGGLPDQLDRMPPKSSFLENNCFTLSSSEPI